MTRLFACIAAFAVAASSAVAQVTPRVTTQNDQTQASNQGGAIGPSAAPTQAPRTGVFCIEEMTATFCNVVTGPNTGGYGGRSGSTGGATSTRGGIGAGSAAGASATGGNAGGGTSSIPPCPAQPPFNELCA